MWCDTFTPVYGLKLIFLARVLFSSVHDAKFKDPDYPDQGFFQHLTKSPGTEPDRPFVDRQNPPGPGILKMHSI